MVPTPPSTRCFSHAQPATRGTGTWHGAEAFVLAGRIIPRSHSVFASPRKGKGQKQG